VRERPVLVGALALGEVGPNFEAAHAADEENKFSNVSSLLDLLCVH